MKLIFPTTYKQSGYVMLFSILITAIILSIVIGIANVTFRQRQLTQQINDSTKAFYSAEAALECVIAMDDAGAFGVVPDPMQPPSVQALCSPDINVLSKPPASAGPNGSTRYYFAYDLADSSYDVGDMFRMIPIQSDTCAAVIVTKFEPMGPGTNPGTTIYRHTIESRGYNLTCTGDDSRTFDHFVMYLYNPGSPPSPYASTLVERSLSYTYETEQ